VDHGDIDVPARGCGFDVVAHFVVPAESGDRDPAVGVAPGLSIRDLVPGVHRPGELVDVISEDTRSEAMRRMDVVDAEHRGDRVAFSVRTLLSVAGVDPVRTLSTCNTAFAVVAVSVVLVRRVIPRRVTAKNDKVERREVREASTSVGVDF